MPFPEYCTLDLWSTLILSHPEFKAKRSCLFGRFFNVPTAIEQQVAVAIREVELLADGIAEISGTVFCPKDLYAMVLSKLDYDLKKIDPGILELFYQETEELFFRFPPRFIEDDLLEDLRCLKTDGLSFGLICNTGFIGGSTLSIFLEKVGLSAQLEALTFSDSCRWAKPSPHIFAAHFQELTHKNKSILPNDTIHIGDNPRTDGIGAMAMGMSYAQYIVGGSTVREILQHHSKHV